MGVEETVTGQGVWQWGSWMAQEPDFTLLCTRPRGRGKSSVDALSLRHLQDNSTVSWGLPRGAKTQGEGERLDLEVRGRGRWRGRRHSPVWPKGRQITVWEGA